MHFVHEIKNKYLSDKNELMMWNGLDGPMDGWMDGWDGRQHQTVQCGVATTVDSLLLLFWCLRNQSSSSSSSSPTKIFGATFCKVYVMCVCVCVLLFIIISLKERKKAKKVMVLGFASCCGVYNKWNCNRDSLLYLRYEGLLAWC